MPGLLAYILGTVQVFINDLWSQLGGLNTAIESQFGEPAKWAFWILAAAFILLLVGKATKLTFNILRYVILPSAAMAVVLLMIMPCWSPAKTFPLFVVVTTAMMLFRSE
ncbi:MAG: hypothetical protein GF341_03865 [candidate division Zixibacteria bacterium]|nr:hypothetical protein [candidate division Zixibacteria bacterium]